MTKQQELLTVITKGRSFIDLTDRINKMLTKYKIDQGLCHIFLQHTSASLVITENADPDVKIDLENYFSRLVQDGDKLYRHTAEGDDDMSAHIRCVLTQQEITIPVTKNHLNLGTWQGLYIWEQRYRGHDRQLVVSFLF